MKPTVALIAVVASNGAIGRNNRLLVHLPEDLKHFKRTTLGHPVVMGRKTFDAIGRPLPGRRNIVVTHDASWRLDGVERADSLDAALASVDPGETVYVIGGGELYAQALPLADELVLTELDPAFDGDTFFPRWDRSAFAETSRESHVAPQGWRYHFVRYRRKVPGAG
jgi:dihydrofolate reductase